ncbi:MAG: tetratricopeptide repeat protein, partial [Thermoanaerobaculia bacterium]
VAAMQGGGPEVMSMFRAKRWLAVAAVLAAAAIFLVWLARHSPAPMPEARVEAPVAAAPRSWKELPIVVAPYAPAPEDELVFRSDEPAREAPAGFAETMTPYARGDYAAAEAILARYLLAHPRDGGASFYRGVSLLLIGRPEDAVPLLEAAAESGPPPEGARWYLALAQLKSGNEDAALRELDAVAGAEGAHQREAAELAKEVRSARDARRR